MPVRTCLGCRRRLETGQLVRIRSADGELVVGPGPGRGAWIGPSSMCLEAAVRRRGIARALRAEVDPAAVARLRGTWPPGPPVCPHEGR